jgi:hypothetical protein
MTRSGTTTWSTSRMTAPACSISTATSCTKSPARRPSKACAWPASQGARAGKDARRRRPQRADRRTGRSASKNEESRIQVEALAKNAADFGVEYFNENDKRQGIVHIVGPEQGFTLPGTTIVCGDSHTSTHGAFGALAHGIGTSEVEHVLATQTLIQKKAKNMLVRSMASCPRASPPRTSSSPSSARSAPPAAPATSSSLPAKRSARCRWKAA